MREAGLGLRKDPEAFLCVLAKYLLRPLVTRDTVVWFAGSRSERPDAGKPKYYDQPAQHKEAVKTDGMCDRKNEKVNSLAQYMYVLLEAERIIRWSQLIDEAIARAKRAQRSEAKNDASIVSL